MTAVPRDSLQLETYVPPITQAARNRFGRFSAPGVLPVPAAPEVTPNAPHAAAVEGNSSAAAAAAAFQVANGLARGFFSTAARTLVHRSSLVLLLYILLHAAGNSLFFAGAPVFDAYVATLKASAITRAVEAYLLVATVAHALSGFYLTIRYKRLAWPARGGLSAWFGGARLIVTGVVIIAFIVLHLMHFRFAPASGQGVYSNVIAVLSDPATAALYVAATALVGLHLVWGWEKAVVKFVELDPSIKPLAAPMKGVGQAVAASSAIVLCAVTVSAYIKATKQSNVL